MDRFRPLGCYPLTAATEPRAGMEGGNIAEIAASPSLDRGGSAFDRYLAVQMVSFRLKEVYAGSKWTPTIPVSIALDA